MAVIYDHRGEPFRSLEQITTVIELREYQRHLRDELDQEDDTESLAWDVLTDELDLVADKIRKLESEPKPDPVLTKIQNAIVDKQEHQPKVTYVEQADGALFTIMFPDGSSEHRMKHNSELKTYSSSRAEVLNRIQLKLLKDATEKWERQQTAPPSMVLPNRVLNLHHTVPDPQNMAMWQENGPFGTVIRLQRGDWNVKAEETNAPFGLSVTCSHVDGYSTTARIDAATFAGHPEPDKAVEEALLRILDQSSAKHAQYRQNQAQGCPTLDKSCLTIVPPDPNNVFSHWQISAKFPDGCNLNFSYSPATTQAAIDRQALSHAQHEWDRRWKAKQKKPPTAHTRNGPRPAYGNPTNANTHTRNINDPDPDPKASSNVAPDPNAFATSSNARTCGNCPSFLGADRVEQQRKVLGKHMGMPFCAAKRIPLASMNSDVSQIAEIQLAMAKMCGSFGQPNPDLQALNDAGTGYFAEEDLSITPVTKGDPKADACSGCANFIEPSRMARRFGFPLAGCAARGIFIPTGKGDVVAKSCGFNRPGDFPSRPDLNRIILRPPYAGRITVINDDDTVAADAGPTIEPTLYVSDKPVSDAEKALGIRAWRALTDPDGTGNVVYLPIFDPEWFDDVEKAKIPQTGDPEHPELYRDHQGLLYKMAVLWLHMNETPALNGMPGVGKTEGFRYAAWNMQLPFERISITNSTENDDLQGKMLFENQQTTYQYGRIPNAWRKPCVIVIDEPNVGPPDVWQFLRPLTDDSKQLVLDANKGERIERNEHCFMGMAFNPAWDMRNVGTHEISDADGSRLMHISIPAPDDALERKILAARCDLDGYTIPKAVMDAIMGIAEDLRTLAASDAFPIHWGTRQQIKVARLSQFFALRQAYRMAAGDLLDPQARDQLLVTVDSHQPDVTPKGNAAGNGSNVRGATVNGVRI